MKKVLTIFFLILLGGGIAFCVFMAVDASKRASDTVGIAHEAFDEINKLRTEHGLPELIWDDTLEELAISHSQYMSDTGIFEHSNYSFSYVENIIEGSGAIGGISAFPSGSSIVTPWRTSQGHYMNMINSSISRGAVGVVGNYATFIGQ